MEASELSDEQLVGRLLDPASFEELYRRHVSKVTSFAVRRCSVAHEVPDLVAAVWLEVIQSSSSFDARRGRALPWIFGVAANLTASHERRRQREREAIDRLGRERVFVSDDLERLEEEIDGARAVSALRVAMAELPLGERLVAELVLIDGLSPQEAASALGIRGPTARMRLARGRSKLRRSPETVSFCREAPTPLPEVLK